MINDQKFSVSVLGIVNYLQTFKLVTSYRSCLCRSCIVDLHRLVHVYEQFVLLTVTLDECLSLPKYPFQEILNLVRLKNAHVLTQVIQVTILHAQSG